MASKRVAQVELSHCVSCGTCEKVCPKAAISVWKGCFANVNEALCVAWDDRLFAAPDTCNIWRK